MKSPIRPASSFVLRVWREPGDSKDDNGWRGLVRPLSGGPARGETHEILFYGLDRLLEVLRPLLEEQD